MTSRRRRARVRPLLRILSSLLLLVVCAQSSLAWALAWSPARDTCCGGDAPDHDGGRGDEDGDDDSRDCPCPLDCSGGCAGNAIRGVAPAGLIAIHGPAPAVEVCSPMPLATPGDIDASDILHVPRR
ncbi:MAG: hypothetical protein WKG00_29825 [Polyangiaceae bacterium]